MWYFGKLTKHLGITESRCCQINNFLYAFAVISNALKKLKEKICISRVTYTMAVIFMTLPIVDTFAGLKITLESLKLGADNSTVSCLLLPLFQMLLRNKRKYMHFRCIQPSASHFYDFNSCRYFGRISNHLGITECRCCKSTSSCLLLPLFQMLLRN